MSANCFKHGNDPGTCPQCAELRARYPDMNAKPSKEATQIAREMTQVVASSMPGWEVHRHNATWVEIATAIDAFAARAVEAERAACAEVANNEERPGLIGDGFEIRTLWAQIIANAIRARGQR